MTIAMILVAVMVVPPPLPPALMMLAALAVPPAPAIAPWELAFFVAWLRLRLIVRWLTMLAWVIVRRLRMFTWLVVRWVMMRTRLVVPWLAWVFRWLWVVLWVAWVRWLAWIIWWWLRILNAAEALVPRLVRLIFNRVAGVANTVANLSVTAKLGF
jgi:hypothetical protein